MNVRRATTTLLLTLLAACSASPSARPAEGRPPPHERSVTSPAALPRLGEGGDRALRFTLSPTPLDALPEVTWVELVRGPAGPLLFHSLFRTVPPNPVPGNVVLSTPLAGGPSSPVAIDHGMVPVALRWDAAMRPDGRFAVVFEHALGATNAVFLRSPDDLPPLDPSEFLGRAPSPEAQARVNARLVQGAISPPRSFDSFTDPRFVRGADRSLAITAVVDGRQLALFSAVQSPSREPPPWRRVEVACVDGIVVVNEGGTGLVYKTLASGRADEDEIVTGRLHYVRLQPDLRPAGPPVDIFPNLDVFEIDAAPLADGVAVLATTRAGLAAAVVSTGARGPRLLGLAEHPMEDRVTSPSILADASRVHVAAIASRRSPKARVITGTLDITRTAP